MINRHVHFKSSLASPPEMGMHVHIHLNNLFTHSSFKPFCQNLLLVKSFKQAFNRHGQSRDASEHGDYRRAVAGAGPGPDPGWLCDCKQVAGLATVTRGQPHTFTTRYSRGWHSAYLTLPFIYLHYSFGISTLREVNTKDLKSVQSYTSPVLVLLTTRAIGLRMS